MTNTTLLSQPTPSTSATRVDAYTLVRFSGKDTRDFLQRVLTQDVMHLGSRNALAGYCDPKGRLLDTMRLWLEGDEGVLALMPADNSEALIKRLRMFVLRDDVTLTVLNADYRVVALLDHAADKLSAMGVALPAEGEVAHTSYGDVLRLEDATPLPEANIGNVRVLLVIPQATALPFDVTEMTALFLTSELAAGIPSVWAATNGRFVPQATNLDLVNGVSFTKGCYPGQEVVSRMKHIGKPSRRMFLAKTVGGVLPMAGDPVFAGNDEVGAVVLATRIANVTYVLYSLLLSAADADLAVGETEKAPLEKLALPYTIE